MPAPGTVASTSDGPGRLSKQVSSAPPGPTGKAARLPRTTSYCVAFVAAAQLYVVLFAAAATLSVSGGAVIAVPLHEPPPHVSLIVHALPSLHAFVLLVNTHPVAALQVSVVQALLSLQVRRQLVATWYGLGPVEENVIQPAFSDHARPLKTPVQPLITTPAPAGAKLIQPLFSDQA